MFAMRKGNSRISQMLGIVALVVLVSLMFAGSALAETYYVNSAAAPGGDGSESAPWNTLQAADAAGLAPGSLVLCTGTFDVGGGNGFNPIVSSGTADAHITYKAVGGASIVGTNIDVLIEADYVDMDGFDVSGGLIGIEYYASKGGNITNCVVHDCSDRGIAIDSPVPQSAFETDVVAVFRNNLIFNIAKNGGIGWGCIHVFHTNGAQIDIFNNTTSGGIVGIIIGENTDMNVEIRNNIITNALYGLDYVATYGTNNSYVNTNNLYYGNASGDYLYAASKGDGEFNTNPLFVNPSAHNYHLTECTSPAINCGFLVPGYVQGVDYISKAPDMGCFETSCDIKTGTVEGWITDARFGTPLQGAKVTDGTGVGITDSTGYYSVKLEVGTRTITASRTGYIPEQATVEVLEDQVIRQDFVLERKAPAAYYVDDATGSDQNDGTAPNKAWKTIGHGDAAGLLSAGDTVYVAAGTYAQSSADGVHLQNCPGDEEGNITYKATGPVLIDQTAYLGGGDPVRGFRVDVSYVTIDGFEIIKCNRAVDLWCNRKGCVVANCKIHDLSNGPDGSAVGVLIFVDSSCYVHSNLIYNIGDGTTGGLVGCVWASQQAGVTVDNNTLSGCLRGCCIDTPGTTAYARNNIITRTTAGLMSVNQRDVVHTANLFFENTENFLGTSVAPMYGTKEFQADPLLDSDYKPLPGSPAINTGIKIGLAYQGPAPDLGYFETDSASVTGAITGTVTANLPDNPPIPGANVETDDALVAAITGPDGRYWLPFAPGNHDIKAYADRFDTQFANGVPVIAGQETTRNFVLNLDNGGHTGYPYYVSPDGDDLNAGWDPESAWKTIQNGDATGVLLPGDTVFVLPGTYDVSQFPNNLGITIGNCAGASPLVPITYKALSEPGNPVVIDGAGTSFGFVIGASNIVLDGFEIQNCTYSVDFNSTFGARATGCYVHDYLNAGLYTWAAYGTKFDHNVIGNGLGRGIYPQGSTNTSVLNNTIVTGETGVDCSSAGNTLVANNILGSLTTGIIGPCTNHHNMFFNASEYVADERGNGDLTVSDPMFAGEADFHLQSGSPAVDKGAKVGFAYSGLAPDCGAFESSYTVAPAPKATIADAKSIADGSWVEITEAKIATAASDTFTSGSYYIEEPDRSSGIKVAPQAGLPAVAIGNPVTLFGILNTDANGERYIDVASALPSTDVTPVASLGIVNRTLAGPGQSTAGLMVRVWGKVTFRAIDGSYIYVDDGSGVLDGSGRTGIRVILAGLIQPVTKALNVNDAVGITGLAGLDKSGSTVIPVIRTRGDGDIRVF